MLRLLMGIGLFVSSYFVWHTHLKIHSLSEHILELTCVVQFPGRKWVDVLCSAQGHFTLSSHWLHLSKNQLTLAEIKLLNLESYNKQGWNLIAKKQEVKLMNKSVSLKLPPLDWIGKQKMSPPHPKSWVFTRWAFGLWWWWQWWWWWWWWWVLRVSQLLYLSGTTLSDMPPLHLINRSRLDSV